MPTAKAGQEFQELVDRAAREGWAVVGLPEQIPLEGSDFECTIAWEDQELGGGHTDFWFNWSGTNDKSVSFTCVDAQGDPDLHWMTSVGLRGVAHWLQSGHLLVAWWSFEEYQLHGWGVVPDAVKDSNYEEDLGDPMWWARLLVLIDQAMVRAGSHLPPADDEKVDGAVYS